MIFISISFTPFDFAVVIYGEFKISIIVVLVTLESVAKAGRESVSAGKMRNLRSPVPEGGNSIILRLKKSMIKSPLQKTGRLNPVTDIKDTKRSIMVSRL